MRKTNTRVDIPLIKTNVKTGESVETIISAPSEGLAFLKVAFAQCNFSYRFSFVDKEDEKLFHEVSRNQISQVNRLYF